MRYHVILVDQSWKFSQFFKYTTLCNIFKQAVGPTDLWQNMNIFLHIFNLLLSLLFRKKKPDLRIFEMHATK